MQRSVTLPNSQSMWTVRQELRRGFKAEAERIAQAIREELGLFLASALNCEELCQHLGIPVISVPDLIGSDALPKSVECITSIVARITVQIVQ